MMFQKYPRHKRIPLYLITVMGLMIFLLGCEDYYRTYEIIRSPRITVQIGDNRFISTDYEFNYIGTVIGFPDSLSTTSESYYRYSLNVFLSEDSNEKMEVILDAKERELIIGVYDGLNGEEGILRSISVTIKDENVSNDVAYSFYSLKENADFQEFIIEDENTSERLIRGAYRASLQERLTDSTFQISGEFNDIKYRED